MIKATKRDAGVQRTGLNLPQHSGFAIGHPAGR